MIYHLMEDKIFYVLAGITAFNFIILYIFNASPLVKEEEGDNDKKVTLIPHLNHNNCNLLNNVNDSAEMTITDSRGSNSDV